MTSEELEIWDRQPDESSWDFARFCLYRDLGPARTLREAVRASLAERRGKRPRKTRVAKDADEVVRRMRWVWDQLSRNHNWVVRAKAFDEAVEREARGRAVEAYVDEEAEQLRLRIVAARTLRSRGLAIWDRFAALVDEGKLEEMTLERIKHVVTMDGSPATADREETPASRAEREVQSLFSQLGLATAAIAEGLKQERLELGEATDRTALEGLDGLGDESPERLRRVRARLRELLGGDSTGDGDDS